MLNVCVCALSRYLSPVVENGICYMSKCLCAYVCVYVVLLSQPSSREWYLLYVKCLCLLSRYISPVVENGICYMLNVCVCCPRYLSPVVENGICSMSNVCVRTYVCVCIALLSQPSSREWYLFYV